MQESHNKLQRRQCLKWAYAGLLGLGLVGVQKDLPVARAAELPVFNAKAALSQLMDGNQRFCQHHPQYPDQTSTRLEEIAQAQHPFATVLSCADSRVPVELLFDQGFGDIFDIRIAGNLATPDVIASLEYAVEVLETPLVMVLGHQRCGAVTAALQNQSLPGEMHRLVDAIAPARQRLHGSVNLEDLVMANVRYQMEQLLRSQLLQERYQRGAVQIVGAYYELDTGRVTLLD